MSAQIACRPFVHFIFFIVAQSAHETVRHNLTEGNFIDTFEFASCSPCWCTRCKLALLRSPSPIHIPCRAAHLAGRVAAEEYGECAELFRGDEFS